MKRKREDNRDAFLPSPNSVVCMGASERTSKDEVISMSFPSPTNNEVEIYARFEYPAYLSLALTAAHLVPKSLQEFLARHSLRHPAKFYQH